MSLTHRSLAIILGLAAVSGCYSEIKFKTRFDSVGQVGAQGATGHRTAPEAVQLFYGSSPDGFSLADNELTVKEGFSHQILGPIELYIDKVRYWSDRTCRDQKANKEIVLEELRKAAAKQGANGVIYASSELPAAEDLGDDNPCVVAIKVPVKEGKRAVGYGWAVVIAPQPTQAEPPSTAGSAAAQELSVR